MSRAPAQPRVSSVLDQPDQLGMRSAWPLTKHRAADPIHAQHWADKKEHRAEHYRVAGCRVSSCGRTSSRRGRVSKLPDRSSVGQLLCMRHVLCRRVSSCGRTRSRRGRVSKQPDRSSVGQLQCIGHVLCQCVTAGMAQHTAPTQPAHCGPHTATQCTHTARTLRPAHCGPHTAWPPCWHFAVAHTWARPSASQHAGCAALCCVRATSCCTPGHMVQQTRPHGPACLPT